MRNVLAAVAAALLLWSCAEDDSTAFKAGLAAATTDLRGQVPPLPELRRMPDFRYEAGKLPDPFYP
jgi:hypothetical protein